MCQFQPRYPQYFEPLTHVFRGESNNRWNTLAGGEGWGVSKVSRELFCFLKTWFWLKARLVYKWHILSLLFLTSRPISMINIHFRKRKCHKREGAGGDQKSAKKVSRIIWMAPCCNALRIQCNFFGHWTLVVSKVIILKIQYIAENV